jgi:methylenetetrahydrofolate reductase (NADPH)
LSNNLALAAEADTAALLHDYSVEITARHPNAAAICRTSLAPGSKVYLAFLPGDTHDTVVHTATALRGAGFEPVPHVLGRHVTSARQLDGFLARLAGDAGVTQALLVAGDIDRPEGPYESGLEVLRSGLLQKHGFRRIGLAVYPEPHPKIPPDLLDQALLDKLEVAAEAGLEPWLVTQFCFEAAPIVERLRRLRAQGVTAPLRIGLAGPASRRTLWNYALHCGIGTSIRALGARMDVVSNLMARRSPDALVADLAAARRREPVLGIEGVHIFTFGGVPGAAAWANGVLAASGKL